MEPEIQRVELGGNIHPPRKEKKRKIKKEKKSYSQSRNFIFTSFGKKKPILTEKIQFLAFGKEICPKTKRDHWQGYCVLKDKKSWKSASKIIDECAGFHCFVEEMRGNLEDSEEYCSKDGIYEELGKKPCPRKRTDLEDLKEEIMNGRRVDEILIEEPMTYHQYGRTLNALEDVYNRSRVRTEMTQCDWIYGPTGVGKSHRAFENFSDKTHFIWKDDNGWWDGYNGQDIVIMNDFRGEIKYNELLKLVDKWPEKVRRRGREPINFISKKIIITSSLSPEDVYCNRLKEDKIKQLLRRVNVIHMEK